MIGNLILRWLLNTVALLVVAIALAPHFSYDSLITVAVAALVLGLLNTLVKPLLFIITLPLTVVTLGLFLLVLNAIMLELTAWLVPGFRIDSFGWAIVGAIVLTLVSLVTNRIGGAARSERR